MPRIPETDPNKISIIDLFNGDINMNVANFSSDDWQKVMDEARRYA